MPMVIHLNIRLSFWTPENMLRYINEINTNYSKFEGKEKCVHLSYYGEKAYMYYFENHGFDNYNIYMRKCVDE